MKSKSAIFRIITAAVLLCTALSLFASCSKRGNKLTPDGTLYKDKKTDVSYVYAPLCYEAIEIGDEIYASSKNDVFYTIEGQDPLKWICEEGGTVFHAKDIPVPAIDEMSISYVDICVESAASITVKTEIENKEDISAIIGAYLSTPALEYSNDLAESNYKLRFADTSLGIYYCVNLLRYSEDLTKTLSDGTVVNYGKDFIYNRFEGRFIPAPEALSKYIDAIS